MLVTLALLGVAACGGEGRTERAAAPGEEADDGSPLRLGARVRAGPRPAMSPGTTRLALPDGAEALVRVPRGYDPARPAPLVLLLHGAGGSAPAGLGLFEEEADAAGLLLAAPSSADRTWDGVLGRPGPDVDAVDRLLEALFAGYAVDEAAVAVGGFSDGASYALGLGLANGDLFRHVVAFSPGFVAGHGRSGRPRLFVSHGRADRVLPIDRCSRRIVREEREAGSDVTYVEFAGGHEVPVAVRQAAVRWLLEPER